MSYPGVINIGTVIVHEDENITVKNQSQGTVAAFLPRLTPGGSISINASRNLPGSTPLTVAQAVNWSNTAALGDFSSNIEDYTTILLNDTLLHNGWLWIPSHYQPYSIIATYDQGSSKFNPPYPLVHKLNPIQIISNTNLADTNVLLPLVLIALAFLFFGIAFRRKTRSKSKLASDILTDIMKVREELTNNDKGDPSGIILRLHPWKSDTNKRQIVSDYRDYQKIDDFYSTVKSRNRYLLRKEVSSDELSKWNQECVNKATIINNEIDWRKFHKLDLILLIPVIILGSLVLSVFYTIFSLSLYSKNLVIEILLTISPIILRGVSAFFITRWTLRAVQGIIVNIYGLPSLHRSFAFLVYSFVITAIMAPIIGSMISVPLEYVNKIISYTFYFYINPIVSYIIDLGSMFLLTWVVWRHYMKHKVGRLHSLVKKETVSSDI